MNISFIKHDSCERVVLIMAGWGMDPGPFHGLTAPGYDIAVAWDYTDETFDRLLLAAYREVVVIAWSMGVMECGRILPAAALPVTLTVAVNGTPCPVDDDRGIPRAVFSGTLSTLSEATLERFNRRMCGSAQAARSFAGHAPRRSVESLRRELEAIGARAAAAVPAAMRWDVAVAGRRDMIFPFDNQARAWEGTPLTVTDDPHLPDFRSVISRFVIDKQRVASRFDSARGSYDRAAVMQHRVAAGLARKLLRQLGGGARVERAIEIGPGSCQLTRLYAPALSISRLELWDIAPVGTVLPGVTAVAVTDDAEARLMETPDASADLVVSASTLQWFNSPVSAVAQIQRILRPGGVAALSLYTDGTYASLARATGVSLRYVTPGRLRAAVAGDCTIISMEVNSEAETFGSSRELIEHMRLTGVNAAGASSTAALRDILRNDTLRQLEYVSTTLIIQKQ